jgi:hypothetical protein
LSLIPVSGTASGTVHLELVAEDGVYFTNILFGPPPEASTLYVLDGESNNFSSIQFQSGATLSGGSFVIGSAAPSGVLQTVNLETFEVLQSYSSPYLEDDNIEDFS